MMAPAFRLCESHPGRRLIDHLEDVAERLAASDGSLRLAAFFHDVGKATEYFQHYLKGLPVLDLRLKQHAHLGAVSLLHHLWPKVVGQEIRIEHAAMLYLIVAEHHTGLNNALDCLPPTDESGQERWKKQLQAFDVDGAWSWLEKTLHEPVEKPDTNLPWPKIRRHLGSALRQAVPDSEIMHRFQDVLRSFGSLIEADRDSASGFDRNAFESPARFTTTHLDQFLATSSFKAADPGVIAARAELYQAASTGALAQPANSGHLWSMTAPTGAGKTLAAVGWALARREARIAAGLPACPIIYALPFTSIIDQNAAVLRRLWGNGEPDESTLAVHHHVAEPGELAKSGEQSLARTWVEGWRADIVCTTFVQVVNSLFHGTVSDARRFSRVAGSILILDEIQAIPAKFWPLINTALRTLSTQWKTDVLLMTATQPAIFESIDVQELAPGLPKISGTAFDRYDLHIDTEQELTLPELADRVRAVMSEPERPSCLIILNTVQEALDLFELVRPLLPLDADALFHLSTNLRPKDRKRILESIAKRQDRPHLLIATQVVEAGVDLSFDVVFRALAPLDAVVQAAGRCNRHGTGRRGRVYLIRLVGHTGHLIYGDTLMGAAREVLAGNGRQVSEARLQQSVVHYFQLVARRISRDPYRKIMEAVQMWEFAFLRGEADDKKDLAKAVRLIDDRGDTMPHYVEVDSSDAEVWRRFCAAIALDDLNQRRRRLRQLRPEMGQRIVEVPNRLAATFEAYQQVVHVPQQVWANYYDINTGWKRARS